MISLPLTVAAVDGEISALETAQIANMCAFSPIFHVVGTDGTSALAVEVVIDRKTKGATEVFKRAAAALSPRLRETAVRFAIRVALADGAFDDDEKKMLINMGESLGLSEDTFFTIFDVVLMMQRSSGD